MLTIYCLENEISLILNWHFCSLRGGLGGGGRVKGVLPRPWKILGELPPLKVSGARKESRHLLSFSF